MKSCPFQEKYVNLHRNMKTPTVTLTTDWGNQGFFAGMVKGRLHSLVEGVRVVDVTHHVEPYSVVAATFVVRHGCLGFPEGTVHIVDVASNPEGEHPFVALKVRGQYFLCCDNGLPSMAFGEEVEAAVSLPMQENRAYNFAAYSLFTVAAAKLLHGVPLEELGPRVESLRQRLLPSWVRQGNEYRIPIQYIDSYGNAYLGMSFREFEELRQGRAFVLQVRDIRITEVVRSYHWQPPQPSQPLRRPISRERDLRLTVSATGALELAISNSFFAPLFGLHINEMVLLEFK